MSNFKTLACGDFHLSDRKYKNKDLEDFEEEAQREAWNKILGIIDEYKVNKLILNGDIFDAPPVGTSLELFHNFMLSLKEKDLEIIMISGNHCLLEGLREKKYYPNLMKKKWWTHQIFYKQILESILFWKLATSFRKKVNLPELQIFAWQNRGKI